ncbi:MAG: hypothetical protein M0D55_11680 [Elusimicrobiota bacterium]|nr:MAG: hypothetical protein M0D55_11680 [Elusimicrobiota bacterium]
MIDLLMYFGVAPILVMAGHIVLTRGPRRKALAWKPAPGAPLRIPSAEETAESVRRFREASERAVMMDFVWENYSKGRALFIEEMRIAASKRKSRSTMSILERL